MDLGFPRFDAAEAADFAVLMVVVTARQGASPSARRQAALARPATAAGGLLAPGEGSFCPAMARALRPRGEE